jgi:aerotaxis receptor
MKRPTPLDASRDFRVDEMFFSTTDRKGRIQLGNDAFVRVSGYARAELVGQAHNIVRHPDMPRSVFRLVWDRLARGQTVAGLIKNMASDGRYYWVVALLTPIENGYLSIRFKPTTSLHAKVEAIYRQMHTAEQSAEAAGKSGSEAMDSAEQLLTDALQSAGFPDYESFMRALLHDELKGRDEALAQAGLALFPERLPDAHSSDASLDTLRLIYDESRKAYDEINTLYANLDELSALNTELGERSKAVLKQTVEFRFIAFNAALRAARLGGEAASLGVIADYLGGASTRTTAGVTSLSEGVAGVSTTLSEIIFNLAAARLQIEMLLSFCVELARDQAEQTAADNASRVPSSVRREMIEKLQHAFSVTIDRALQALTTLQRQLRTLTTAAEELRRTVLTLQVAQVGGLVEATRIKDDDSFVIMFADLREGVENTKRSLMSVDEITGRLFAMAENTPAVSAVISAAVEQMRNDVQKLSHESELTAMSADRSDFLPNLSGINPDLRADVVPDLARPAA